MTQEKTRNKLPKFFDKESSCVPSFHQLGNEHFHTTKVAHTFSEELPRIEYNIPTHLPGKVSLSFIFFQRKVGLAVCDEILSLLRNFLFEDGSATPNFFAFEPFGSQSFNERKAFQALYTFSLKSELDLELVRVNIDRFVKITKKALIDFFPHVSQNNKPDEIRPVLTAIYPYIYRFPHKFDSELLEEAKRFVLMTPSIFRRYRHSSHIGKIITSFNYGLKKLEKSNQSSHPFFLRVIHHLLESGHGLKNSYGLCIVTKELREFQYFSKEALFSLFKASCPWIRINEKSFITVAHPDNQSTLIYFDINLIEGQLISAKEKEELHYLLEKSFERSIITISSKSDASINDEDALKNLALLSQEIDSEDDLPQVSIHNIGQAAYTYYFMVLIVRPWKNDAIDLRSLFESNSHNWKFNIERQGESFDHTNNLTKESCVCTVSLQKDPHSIKYEKRETYEKIKSILEFLESKLGDIRAFNGCFISEQLHAFNQYKQIVSEAEPQYPQQQIEQFFFNINPTEKQFLIPLQTIVELFELCFKSPNNEERVSIEEHKNNGFHTIILKSPHKKLDEVHRITHLLRISPSVTLSQLEVGNTHIFIFLWSEDEFPQKNFHELMQLLERRLTNREIQQRALRVSVEKLPLPLDPRDRLSLYTNHIFKFLFEGLTKIDENRKPALNLAHKLLVSKDKKKYTFKLKKALWSDGSLVTADDFVHSWKQLINPKFKSTFSYLFYPIKNARKAKMGEVGLDEVGVYAKDTHTLEVELEYPCPYFLELLSLNIFCPINLTKDLEHPHWYFKGGAQYVCNGPYVLENQSNDKIVLKRNKFYRQYEKIKLETIKIEKMDTHSIDQHSSIKYDWIVSLPSQSPLCHHEKYKKVIEGQYNTWMKMNLNRYPFHNKNFRRGFSHAIDRKKITSVYKNIGSYDHFLPPSMAAYENPPPLSSKAKAAKYFAKAREQLGIQPNEAIHIELLCPNYYEEHFYEIVKLIQNQLSAFGIQLDLKIVSMETFFDRGKKGHYQIRTAIWTFLVNTPFYLLDIFYSPATIDLYQWTSKKYQKVYNEWCNATTEERKKEKQASLEKILLNEYVIAPIYYENRVGLVSNELINVKGGSENTLDFLTANFKPPATALEKQLLWVKPTK